MSKYRVKSGLHVVNNQLLRVGEIVEVKSDKFLNAERAPFFEKVVESEKAKEPKKVKESESTISPAGPVGPVAPVGQPGELGPDDTGVGDKPGVEGPTGIPGPIEGADVPKKRGPKPKTPAE